MNLQNGALTGIRVLDLSRLLPGPYCSMILADHGAEVIAVEDKRFQAAGHYIALLNRNKRHLALDLKTPEGRAVFLKLADRADVLIEGFRPGVARRLGVDYDTLRERNPGLVYCAITGYGQSGPLRDRAGHDVNYLAAAGVLELVGEPGRAPVIPGVQLADIAGGGMNGAIGILLALMARERTGKGQYVDISMADGMVGMLPLAFFFRQLTGAFPQRGAGMLSHRYACYNTYETADGRFVALGAVEPVFWQRLCEHLEMPDWIPLQYDETRREEIIADLREIFRAHPLAYWQKRLERLDACCEPVRTLEEVMAEPHFRERGTLVTAADETGRPADTLGVAVKLSGTPGGLRTPPVAFGASTRDILRELGYDDAHIERLYAKNVV